MRHLGIDYGSKRIGIALSDEAGDFAYPHSVIENNTHVLKTIGELCTKENVGAIVIGDSRDFSGKENLIMKKVHMFKKELEGLKLPIFFELEFMTSQEAEHIQGKRDSLDASAAALILKSYLGRGRA